MEFKEKPDGGGFNKVFIGETEWCVCVCVGIFRGIADVF